MKKILWGVVLLGVTSCVPGSTPSDNKRIFLGVSNPQPSPSQNPYCLQANWYVDPQNSYHAADGGAPDAGSSGDAGTGNANNNTNNGASITSPLSSWGEVERRLNGCRLQQNTTFYGLSNGNPTDPINVRYTVAGGYYAAYIGGPTTTIGSGSTALYGPSTCSAVTAINRATNTFTQCTDNGSVNWSTGCTGSTSCVGQFFRVTSGTHAGAVSVITKDQGSSVARLSLPIIPSSTVNSYLGTVSAISASSDTYQVDQLQQQYAGEIIPTLNPSASAFNGLSYVIFQDIEFAKANVNGIFAIAGAPAGSIILKRCRIDPATEIYGSTGAFVYLQSSMLNSTTAFHGGWTYLLGGAQVVNNFLVESGATVIIGIAGYDFTAEGTSGIVNQGGSVTVSNLGVADTVTSSGANGINTRGSGIVTGGAFTTTQGSGGNTLFTSGGAYYGSGNAGGAVDVLAGHSAEWGSTYSFTAVGSDAGVNDIYLGGTNTNIVTIATPPALYTDAGTSSWANFNLPTADGGLGGNAHNLIYNAHLVQVQ